jgi:predicted Zn finger-like uncharacterized protein
MIIICPKCKARLALPDEKLKEGRTKFKCSKCGASLYYSGKNGKLAEHKSTEDISPPSSQPSKEPTSSRVRKEDQNQPVSEVELHAGMRISGEVRSPAVSDASQTSDTRAQTQDKPAPSLVTLTPRSPEEKQRAPMRLILAGASGIMILVLIGIFFFRSSDKVPQEQPQSPAKDKVTAAGQSPPTEPVSQERYDQSGQGGSSAEKDSPEQPFRAIPPSEMNQEQAIEIVKKSDALLKNTPVDEIVRAWTTQNAGHYTVVGWQARKIDAQRYLVSYTALDGNLTKGFYFDLDVETGVVQDLAHNPELQKKYNVEYSR